MTYSAAITAALFGFSLLCSACSPSLVLAESIVADQLPGGATALTETFENWTVNCAVAQEKKRCVLLQQQTNQQTRQLTFAIELSPAPEGAVVATLVLPFGLALQNGVALQIDDQAKGEALKFRTCLPVGCLVGVTFDKAKVSSLRTGTTLKATALADGGNDISFSAPLKGFSAALDRVQVLVK